MRCPSSKLRPAKKVEHVRSCTRAATTLAHSAGPSAKSHAQYSVRSYLPYDFLSTMTPNTETTKIMRLKASSKHETKFIVLDRN